MRQFFATRSVLEVDTPVVVNAPVTDVHIHSAEVRFPDAPGRFYLHTSPEFAMKRLLASGSGDIYQICHVARGLERGRHHNAEFTLIEWYRLGFSLDQLMDEVEALARAVLGPIAQPMRSERVSCVDAFKTSLGIDPLTAPLDALRACAAAEGLVTAHIRRARRAARISHGCENRPDARQERADLHPPLSRLAGCARASRSRRPARARCASSSTAKASSSPTASTSSPPPASSALRFEHDLAERRRRGLAADKMDELLLQALDAGLPECAGVALGFDRLAR